MWLCAGFCEHSWEQCMFYHAITCHCRVIARNLRTIPCYRHTIICYCRKSVAKDFFCDACVVVVRHLQDRLQLPSL